MSIKQRIFTKLLNFLAILLALAMAFFPEATFLGANKGLSTWALILVPSLLPFFIIADLLMELNVLNFFGKLVEPLMRPVFKQPGEAGFVLIMGLISGFPMGAILTNNLYEKNLCTKEEASRLVAFTNNCSPLFLLIAIPVGMLNNASLGLLFAFSHYLANLVLGIFLGLKKGKSQELYPASLGSPIYCITSWSENKNESDKNFGNLIGNAIKKSISNLLNIGGFVVFFAVLIEILSTSNVLGILNLSFNWLLNLTSFNPELAPALSIGLFEITLGAKLTSEISASLLEKALLISLMLGWAGLSIQAQVCSILSQNQISIKPYLFGRPFQGIIAMLLSACLYYPLTKLTIALPVLSFNYLNIYRGHLYILNFVLGFFLFLFLGITSIIIRIAKKIFIR